MNKFLFFLTTTIILALNSLNAQIVDPVKWAFSNKQLNDDEYVLTFKASIDDTWHLYSTDIPDGGPLPTKFSFNLTDDYELMGDIEVITKPHVKYDNNFQIELKTFSHSAVFSQKIKLKKVDKAKITGVLQFMCCNENTCSPPKDVDFEFNIAKPKSITKKSKIAEEIKTASVQDVKEDTQSLSSQNIFSIDEKSQDTKIYREKEPDASKSKEDKSMLVFFLVAFLAGLAAILTPCVFPMIPMTVTFFMNQGKSKGKGIFTGLIFGISIVVIYTLIGIIVSLSSAGADFANQLSSHWIPNIIFFVLFIVFAASFFGMFELVLPSSLINKADKKADSGGFIGAFFMALTTVVVSFSCTGPIVGALLVEAASGEVVKPTIGMFGFGLAFALPFTLFAIFPGWLKNLPKSGGWLNSVKVVLGFIVLAFAFKFLIVVDQTYHWNVLTREIYLAIWITLFTLLGLYLIGKIKFSHDSNLSHVKFPRLILAIASFSFVIYLFPGMFGAPLKGISALLPPKTNHSFDLMSLILENKISGSIDNKHKNVKYGDLFHLPHGLNGYFDYEEGLEYAKKMNKPILLDLKGHACSNCKAMEDKVWSDPKVLQILNDDYVIIAFYIDDNTKLLEDEWVISNFDGKTKKTIGKKNLDFQITKFETNTQHYYVLLDHNGNKLNEPKGLDLNIDSFIKFLEQGKQKFKN